MRFMQSALIDENSSPRGRASRLELGSVSSLVQNDKGVSELLMKEQNRPWGGSFVSTIKHFRDET